MKLTCRRCRGELSRLPVGEEPGAALAAHLNACPACRRWREQDAAAWAALGTLAEPVPPPELAARIVEASGRIRPREGFGTWLRLAAAGAALAGALAGAWLGSGLFPPPLESEPARAPEETYADMFDTMPAKAFGLPVLDDAASWRLP